MFLRDAALPNGTVAEAGAIGEVIRELEGGDRLVVEILALRTVRDVLEVDRTGMRVEVERDAVRPNTLTGMPWQGLGPGHHWD